MVSSSDLTANKPTSANLITVATGEVISSPTENANNFNLLTSLQLVYDWARDNGVDKTLNNIFTGAINSFNNILKVATIQPTVTNGDLSLDPNGTGKIRYLDGSTDTEVASKGYVQGVAFVAGNVPAGGTSSTYLRGDGSWQAVAQIPLPTLRTSSTTALAPIQENTYNIVDSSAGSITHFLPTSATVSMRPIYFTPKSNQNWSTTNWTLDGNGDNIVVINSDGTKTAAVPSINMNADVNVMVYHDGTDFTVVRA